MKTAVITGGSGYVGGAVIDMLLKKHFRVLNISRSAVEKNGVENILCDLSDAEATKIAAETVKEKVSVVDVFIHAACPPTTRKALEDVTEEECAREFAIAVDAAEIFAQELLPHMSAGSSFIGITTASLDKEMPEKNIGAYIPAKAALRALVKKLAEQWEDKGIHVYDVAPTFLPGGLNKNLPEGVRNLLARQKDGTIPTATDVAKTIENLLNG